MKPIWKAQIVVKLRLKEQNDQYRLRGCSIEIIFNIKPMNFRKAWMIMYMSEFAKENIIINDNSLHSDVGGKMPTAITNDTNIDSAFMSHSFIVSWAIVM